MAGEGALAADPKNYETMLLLSEFTRIVTPRGITAVMLDPHEFANVLGVEGIRYVLVNGVPVVRDGTLEPVTPGRAVRAPVP